MFGKMGSIPFVFRGNLCRSNNRMAGCPTLQKTVRNQIIQIFSFSQMISRIIHTPLHFYQDLLLHGLLSGFPKSGFKTPSKAQWLRCRPPVNAHIPMYAENNDFPDRPAPYP
jgi:hypothetical protein